MISLVGVRRRLKTITGSNSHRCCACVGETDMGKGIRNVNTTSKRFVDTATRQFLVGYSFLMRVPGGLR